MPCTTGPARNSPPPRRADLGRPAEAAARARAVLAAYEATGDESAAAPPRRAEAERLLHFVEKLSED